jgi:hypothetical protein
MSGVPWPIPVETETEWLTCTDPQPMLMFLRGNSTDRKGCFFEAACCRRIWHLLRDDRTRAAIEALERYADDATLFLEMVELTDQVDAVCNCHNSRTYKRFQEADWAVLWATMQPREDDQSVPTHAASAMAYYCAKNPRSKAWNTAWDVERLAQAALLREIIGNPFRPITINPSWLTSTVLALASGIYGEKAFDRMPILADALQDAGCDSEDILTHCRQPGEHVRGCWCVDLLLNKQ